MTKHTASRRMLHSNLIVFSLFLLLGLALRFSAFFQSSVDWDEGVYLLMARSFLDGHPLYTEVWANTPPGIYLLYALAQTILGDSILSIRIVAWIASSITCYLLYHLGILIGRGRRSFGILVGILYAVFSLNSQGLAANTEIFFTPFVVLAFLLLMSRKEYPRRLFTRTSFLFLTIGLLLGVAFEIKYVVVFDFLALLLIANWCLYRHVEAEGATFLRRGLLCNLLLGIGFSLPFLLVSLLFYLGDHIHIYVQTNIVANIIHGTATQFSLVHFLEALSREVTKNSLLWLCLFLTPAYFAAFTDLDLSAKRHLVALAVWFSLAFLGVCYTRLYYSHYFLQVLSPLCLMSAIVIDQTMGSAQVADRRTYFFLLALIALGPLAINGIAPIGRGGVYAYQRWVKGNAYWGDEPASIAAYLQDQVEDDDYIYAVDYPPTIYYLAPGRLPTKYVFPLFLIDERFSTIAGVDAIQELDDIMRKRPVYVIKQYASGDRFYQVLNKYLSRDYFVEIAFNDAKLYRIRDDLQ